MHWADKFGYFEDEQVKVIRMGYKEGSAFMYVILPAQPFGLDNVLQSINGKMVQKWVENTAENDEIKIEVCIVCNFMKFTISHPNEYASQSVCGSVLCSGFWKRNKGIY